MYYIQSSQAAEGDSMVAISGIRRTKTRSVSIEMISITRVRIGSGTPSAARNTRFLQRSRNDPPAANEGGAEKIVKRIRFTIYEANAEGARDIKISFHLFLYEANAVGIRIIKK